MIGMATTRKPVCGIMAKQMLEHMAQMSALRDQGAVQYVRPKRKSKILLVEATNENK